MMKDNHQTSSSDTVVSSNEAGKSVEAGPVEKPEPLYCVLSEKRKIASILVAASVGFLTPTSSDIYYPALDVLAHDLGVSKSEINISIVLFLVCHLCLFSLSLSLSIFILSFLSFFLTGMLMIHRL